MGAGASAGGVWWRCAREWAVVLCLVSSLPSPLPSLLVNAKPLPFRCSSFLLQVIFALLGLVYYVYFAMMAVSQYGELFASQSLDIRFRRVFQTSERLIKVGGPPPVTVRLCDCCTGGWGWCGG